MKYLIAFFVFLCVLTSTTQGFPKINIDAFESLTTPIIDDLSKDLSSNNDNVFDQFEDFLRDIKRIIPFKYHQEIPIEKSHDQLSKDDLQHILPDIISRLPRSIIDNVQQAIKNELSKCFQTRSYIPDNEISTNNETDDYLKRDIKDKMIDLPEEGQRVVLNDIDIQANCMSTLRNHIQQFRQLLKDIEFIIPFPSQITDETDKLQDCTYVPDIEKHPFLYKGKIHIPKGSKCSSICRDLSLPGINIVSCSVLLDGNDTNINEDTKVNDLPQSEKVNIDLEKILPEIDFENVRQIFTTLRPDIKREIDNSGDVKINSGLDVNANSTEADADFEIRVRVNKSPRDGDANANGCSKGNANEDGKVDRGDNSGSVDRNAKRSIDDSNNGADEKTGENVGEVTTTKSSDDADTVGGMNIGGFAFEINRSKERGENMFGIKLKLPNLPFLGGDDQDKMNEETKNEENINTTEVD